MKNNIVKKLIKDVYLYTIVFIGLALVFTILMVVVYTLPKDKMKIHLAESIEVLKNEEPNKSNFFQTHSSSLDTFTDELILNIATSSGKDDNSLKNSMENAYYWNPEISMGDMLQEMINNDEVSNHEYSRYWHGIQVIIKPLLLFFNYTEIRYILMIIIIILLGLVFSLISKQLGIRYSIAFAITVSFMYVILIPVSLQYSSVFIVALISIIVELFLYKKEKERFIPVLFFIIGSVTTFFDLLTYPLITFGFPIILAVIIESKKGLKVSKQIIFIMKLGLLWGMGYGMLFFTKWLIASVVLNKNAVSEALNNLLFRVNGSEEGFLEYRLKAIETNFNYFFIPIVKHILEGMFLAWGVGFILYKKKLNDCKVVIALICIATVPYIWYIVVAGHSVVHCWFTNKIQSITVFAILCAMAFTINIDKIGKYSKNIVKRNR